jgi:hypothetical protein
MLELTRPPKTSEIVRPTSSHEKTNLVNPADETSKLRGRRMNSSNSALGFWKGQFAKWWFGLYVGLAIRWELLARQRGLEYNTVAGAETEAFTDWFVTTTVDVVMSLPPRLASAAVLVFLLAIIYPKLSRVALMAEASVRRNGLFTTIGYGAVMLGLAAGYMAIRADPPAELEPFLTRGIHQ